MLLLAGVAGAVLVLAILVRLVPSAPRRRVRRSVILYGFYAAAMAATAPLAWMHADAARSGVEIAAQTLLILIVINLSAIALFDLILHLLRVDFPDILHDLAVGAAYIVALGWLLHRCGVNLTGIVATSAVVTAVIGLSLQTTLVNVVGGLALQLDGSIDEGDWIELENKVQGQVKKIRWRYTVIETRDWDTLVVPNGVLLSQSFKVLGKRENEEFQRRLWVYFNVDFRYRPGDVIRTVNEALQSAPIPNVAATPRPHCICYDFAALQRDSFATYAVRYWLTDLRHDDGTNSAVRERIYAGLKRAGIPLAVPAATVFVSQDDPEHAARKREREIAFRLAALDGVVLFARLSHEEKLQLAEVVRHTPFSGGEIMTKQGSAAHWLYILTKGEAEVRITNGQGYERKVATIKAPGFFGEMALMTGEPREATVIALTDVECLRLDKAGFQNILAHRPEIAQEMSAILAQRRVELAAVRDNLDADAKKRQMVSERGKILASIREFFGIDQAS
jgi:small-conductance mechanosensitive channel/CRP-like cAMP-binding protein